MTKEHWEICGHCEEAYKQGFKAGQRKALDEVGINFSRLTTEKFIVWLFAEKRKLEAT